MKVKVVLIPIITSMMLVTHSLLATTSSEISITFEKAEQGNAEAQYDLGVCYYLGDGVEKNLEEAVKWYTKAAEQGNAEAQYDLGVCYYLGDGVEKNLEEAVKWYTKAAEQGNAEAQYDLGVCYYLGDGVEKNLEEAVKWYTKAAEQGNTDAQCNLGVCYSLGEGVEKNLEEAVKWYTKATEQRNADAQCNLGVCYSLGEGVEKNLEEAVKWYTKAAEQGNANAQYNLGICYDLGEGVEKNLEEAVKWYTKAAEQGNANAQYNLGICYDLGGGVEKNLEEAMKWYTKAAEQGDVDAQEKLNIYKNKIQSVSTDNNQKINTQNLSEVFGNFYINEVHKDMYGNIYYLVAGYMKHPIEKINQGFMDANGNIVKCNYSGFKGCKIDNNGNITNDISCNFKNVENGFTIYSQNKDMSYISEDTNIEAGVLLEYKNRYLVLEKRNTLDECCTCIGVINDKGEWLTRYNLNDLVDNRFNFFPCKTKLKNYYDTLPDAWHYLGDDIILTDDRYSNTKLLFNMKNGTCFALKNIDEYSQVYNNTILYISNNDLYSYSINNNKSTLLLNLSALQGAIMKITPYGILTKQNINSQCNSHNYILNMYTLKGKHMWTFDKYSLFESYNSSDNTSYLETYKDKIFVKIVGASSNPYLACINAKTGQLEYNPIAGIKNAICGHIAFIPSTNKLIDLCTGNPISEFSKVHGVKTFSLKKSLIEINEECDESEKFIMAISHNDKDQYFNGKGEEIFPVLSHT